MTTDQLRLLAPVFTRNETRLDGKPVDWRKAEYEVFVHLKALRDHLKSPCKVIRETHPNRFNAVDACFTEIDFGRVVMGLIRMQKVSWGIYSRMSLHLDTRAFEIFPARWMAVKPREVYLLHDMKMDDIISNHEDLDDGTAGWAYLKFDHPRAWEALELVVALAENRKTTMV